MKKLIKFIGVFIIAVMSLIVMVGCGDTIYVTGIEVKTSEKTILEGDSEIIVANVLPHNASNDKMQWETSDENVVTVNKGVINALHVGRATVTATTTEGGYSKSIEIVVVKNQFEVSKSFDKTTKGYGITKFSRITDAVATVDNNDEIVVHNGIYDEIVPITKSLKLFGDDATVKGYFIVGYPKLDKYVKDVVIDGFTFICETKTSFSEPACVYIGNETRDLTIRNCKFIAQNENNLGIRNIEGAQSGAVMNPKITLCEFDGFKNAVNFCQYVTAAEINNNVFLNCEFGVFLQGSQQTKIIGNKFIDSGLIALEKAEVPTSKLILKQNNITSETISRKTIMREMIRIRDGDIKKYEKIDLRGNVFFGVRIENLTNQQLERFKTTIDATSPSGNLIDYTKFIFK